MTGYLDYFFSSTILIVIVLMIVLFAGMGLAFSRPFKSNLANNLLWAICIAGCFFIFMIPHFNAGYWSYGLAIKFVSITADKDWICLMDKRTLGSEDPFEYYRLQILDKNTGNRLYRKNISTDGDAKLLAQKGESLFFQERKNFIFWNIPSGIIYQKLNQETLPQIYPVFSGGIENIHYSSQDSLMEVSAKNGMNYLIIPFSLQIYEKSKFPKPAKTTNRPAYWVENSRLMQNNQPYPMTVFELNNLPDNYKIKRLVRSEHVINENLTFLEGSFLGVCNAVSTCIIISYETTDKKNFILTGLDFQGKLLWQMKQAELDADDSFTLDTDLGVSTIIGNDLIFTVGGFVFSIHCQTGKLNWENRL
jgi:hypothetical protein